jgi:hypothetical protein
MPREYCEFSSKKKECFAALKEDDPELFAEMHGESTHAAHCNLTPHPTPSKRLTPSLAPAIADPEAVVGTEGKTSSRGKAPPKRSPRRTPAGSSPWLVHG